MPPLDGSPFIDKPVLFHWLQMSSVWLFGESEPAACRRDDADAVRRYLDANRTGYVLMLRRDFDSLKQDGAPVLKARRRRAIVGRDGSYLRRQVWGNLLVVTYSDNTPVVAGLDLDDEP